MNDSVSNDSVLVKPDLKEVPWSDIICLQLCKPDGDEILHCSQEIEQFGIKTLPLVNYRDGAYRLLTGETEYYAVQLLKWETIPCLVYKGLDDLSEIRCMYSSNKSEKMLAHQIIMNYRQLLRLLAGQARKNGAVEDEIAKIMHVCSRQIRKYSMINNFLTEKELSLMADKKLTLNQAIELAKNRSSQSQKLTGTRKSKR